MIYLRMLLSKQQNVALTPYSPLAAGRLSRLNWHADTKRSQTDKIVVSKYDTNEVSDYAIVERVNKLAEKFECGMTQISLAWHYAKGVTAPIVGATKAKYFDDAIGALNIKLTEEEVAFLDDLYIPHKIVGAI